MNVKCHGCGVEKDPAIFEIYPFPEDHIVIDKPIQPFFDLDCEPNDRNDDWKLVKVCHGCFHKLDPDMWISQRCWEVITPITAFADLPKLEIKTNYPL